jgi:hypothetical protein
MIPATITADLQAFQAAVVAAKPIAGLSPLQLSVLIGQGRDVLAQVDAALTDVGAQLDGPDPAGHPLAMVAAINARAVAAQDAKILSDLRGLLGRAVKNLSAGYA